MWYTGHQQYLDYELYYLAEEVIQEVQGYQSYVLSNFRRERYFLEGFSEQLTNFVPLTIPMYIPFIPLLSKHAIPVLEEVNKAISNDSVFIPQLEKVKYIYGSPSIEEKEDPTIKHQQENTQPSKGLREDVAWETKVKALVVQSELKSWKAKEQM